MKSRVSPAAECSSHVQQGMAWSGSADVSCCPRHTARLSTVLMPQMGSGPMYTGQRGVTLFVTGTSAQPARDSGRALLSIPIAAPGHLPPEICRQRSVVPGASNSADFQSNCSCRGLHLLWCFSSDKFSSKIKL